jgi:osmotically-inducible protein OsmY
MRNKEDSELRRHVVDELEFDPSIEASTIAVAVADGVVTLTGTVPNYAQKNNAERAVKRVAGVRAVAEDLTVKLLGSPRSDTDIAHTALTNLRFNVSVPADRVQLTVEKGWVTLEGELEWQYQRAAAENTIRHLQGVTGITDNIRIKPRVDTVGIKAKIQSAFSRRAQLDANQIVVESDDGKITLRGNVQSWGERRQAEDAAWAAPGVTRVDDRLVVMP